MQSFLGLRGVVPERRRTAEDALDTGLQFTDVEGFGEVVVGAETEN